MGKVSQYKASQRLLVVLPSWVGDTVMATPTLRALRKLYPKAHIAVLGRQTVCPVLASCPWVDQIIPIHPKRKRIFKLARQLSKEQFDTAVLLANSFRSALTMKLAGIKRRVGYDRDGRGFLLTDLLLPRRKLGSFIPVSTRDYYLGIARYLGAEDQIDLTMSLFTRPQQDQQALALLTQHGYLPGKQPLVVIAPGASYGHAKIYPPDRFAKVVDRCVGQLGAFVVMGGAPKERQVLNAVMHAVNEPLLDLTEHAVDLGLFMSIVKHASLVICNDTGPRHLAVAFDVPVVSIFGPTDPAWTEIGFQHERQVSVKVDCGPCQLKKCPLDHRCMTQINDQMIMLQAGELLGMTVPS